MGYQGCNSFGASPPPPRVVIFTSSPLLSVLARQGQDQKVMALLFPQLQYVLMSRETYEDVIASAHSALSAGRFLRRRAVHHGKRLATNFREETGRLNDTDRCGRWL